MAHWTIKDHGFGGTVYYCSECKDVFNDIYCRIYSDSPCPSCGAVMNEDEIEYLDDTYERSAKKTNDNYIPPLGRQQGKELHEAIPSMWDVRLLTNEEAANVLENMAGIIGASQVRGSGKALLILRQVEALLKGASVLRNTPDNMRS